MVDIHDEKNLEVVMRRIPKVRSILASVPSGYLGQDWLDVYQELKPRISKLVGWFSGNVVFDPQSDYDLVMIALDKRLKELTEENRRGHE